MVENRAADRHSADLGAIISAGDWNKRHCRIVDLSQTGFQLSHAGRLDEGDRVFVAISGTGIRRASIVRTAGWRRYGASFDVPLSDKQLDDALSTRETIWGKIALVRRATPSAMVLTS
jgi:hypothetical protein